ncbi:glycosyltransferase family 1 protein [Sclerotinia borealis F-4128]|uniref:Glycosyltransferase family 1 protein n=1 Tax=Sclerotinia borealis (strain F-4128) TaxID=1432307 RepID=W9CFQ8_SCLBF|nr:glycosyltransferase family 1 protein [Sclerotinia borealis F-4128]
MTETLKPLLLICSSPAQGHFAPCKIIAKQLINRGYEVTFLTGTRFGPGLEAIGAAFVPLQGYSDYDDSPSEMAKKWPLRESFQGPARMLYDMEQLFLNAMPSQFESIQRALKIMTDKQPGRQIVLLNDVIFCGVLPLLMNAPGIKPTAIIGIGIASIFITSQDVPPIGTGLFPDSSPEGRVRNLAMHADLQSGPFAGINKIFHDNFEKVGAQRPSTFSFDSMYILPDRFIQLCAPSVEYLRSDLPKTLSFSGGVPKGHRDVVLTTRPTWWEEVTVNPSKKRIVFVSQGTIALNYEDLLIPTIQAFADRDDIIVIAALGVKGASLPESVIVPSNAYVEEFVPFDDILPHCDVFVTNGGYGGFQHGLSNGCPMVMGGETEDKPETCMRGEWTGVGIDLKTGGPGVELLREQVEKILGDGKYKKRAEEIMREMEGYDPVGVFETVIEEVVKEKSALAK